MHQGYPQKCRPEQPLTCLALSNEERCLGKEFLHGQLPDQNPNTHSSKFTGGIRHTERHH